MKISSYFIHLWTNLKKKLYWNGLFSSLMVLKIVLTASFQQNLKSKELPTAKNWNNREMCNSSCDVFLLLTFRILFNLTVASDFIIKKKLVKFVLFNWCSHNCVVKLKLVKNKNKNKNCTYFTNTSCNAMKINSLDVSLSSFTHKYTHTSLPIGTHVHSYVKCRIVYTVSSKATLIFWLIPFFLFIIIFLFEWNGITIKSVTVHFSQTESSLKQDGVNYTSEKHRWRINNNK